MSSSQCVTTVKKRGKQLCGGKTITPRMGEQLTLAALMADVDDLLLRFNEHVGTIFTEFAQIFMDREFSTIFLGRYSMADLMEFSELLLAYAASYMFSICEISVDVPYICGNVPLEMRKLISPRKNRSLKDRIFGIYLTYCLYFAQPQNHIANVKLSVKQMIELKTFCKDQLCQEQCIEALFCINRLVDEHAFIVVPFEKEFNPVLARRFNIAEVMTDDDLDITGALRAESMPSLRSLEKDFTLVKLNVAHDYYMKKKAKLNLPDGMNLVNQSLLSAISQVVTEAEDRIRQTQ